MRYVYDWNAKPIRVGQRVRPKEGSPTPGRVLAICANSQQAEVEFYDCVKPLWFHGHELERIRHHA